MIKNYRTFNEAALELLHVVVPSGTSQTKVATKTCLCNGVLFADAEGNMLDKIDYDIFQMVKDDYFIEDRFSKQFHKTWNKIATTDVQELVYEQVMHYLSTYGREALGLKAEPYIPLERVFKDEYVDLSRKGKIRIIHVVSEKEAVALLDEYLIKTLKPSERTMNRLNVLLEYSTVNPDDLKSFELKCKLYDIRKIVPKDNQMVLRYLVYIATGKTTVVKDNNTIKWIKMVINPESGWLYKDDVSDRVHEILTNADQEKLSEIFLRNKNLFLAFKADKRNAPIINRLRRLAVDHHKPLKEVTIANIMDLIAKGKKDKVEKLLNETSVRNLIKLANFSRNHSETHLYNIRNGKMYINTKPVNDKHLEWLRNKVQMALIFKMKGKLAGNKYYIPNGVFYKAPATEKQLLGNIPYGTTVTAETNDKALCVSIAWEDFEGRTTDLDLHLASATRSFGWNSSYKSANSDVLYSGDITAAPHGATESFRVAASPEEIFLTTVNLFGGNAHCPFRLFLSGEDNFRMKEQGMVDINKALTLPIKLDFNDGSRAISVGYLQGKTFTFYGGNLGSNIVPKKELYKDALEAITKKCESMIPLESIIVYGGGEIIHEYEEGAIDLSPENILATTIFDIIDA